MEKERERIDDLFWRNLRIIQNPQWFCFSLDAVLLADFVTLKSGDQVVDLGTGTGVIPLLLNARIKNTKIIGLEIKSEVANMARRSVILNGLSDQIMIQEGDLRTAGAYLGKGRFDLVISNPPYAVAGSGKTSFSIVKAAARMEILCDLEDVVREGSALFNSEGKLGIVHRPARMADIFWLMRSYQVEPKRMRLVYPMMGKGPNLVLVEGIKNGKKDLQVSPPLFVYQQPGIHSEEMKEIFLGRSLREEW